MSFIKQVDNKEKFEIELSDSSSSNLDLKTQLINTMCQEIIRSSADENMRIAHYEKDNSLLSRGIYYASEYKEALQKTNQKPRLEWLQKQKAFEQGYLSKDHFNHSRRATGEIHSNSFEIKKGIKPSDALDQLRDQVSIIECGTAVQHVQYLCIREILGKNKFNQFFKKEGPAPLTLGGADTNPISKFRKYYLEKAPEENKIRKGDSLYIQNVPKYGLIHGTLGETLGYNVLCISENPLLFTGHGLSEKGATLEEINDHLLEEYNQPAPNGSTHHRLKNKKEFFSQGGGKVTLTSEMDFNLIQKLKESSANQGIKLLTALSKKNIPIYPLER